MKVVKNYRFGNHENKSLKELEKLSEDFNNRNRKIQSTGDTKPQG